MAIERTIAFIKPEAHTLEFHIITQLKSVTDIESVSRVTLTANILRSLYPRASSEQWWAITDHLLGKNVLVIILSGDKIITKVCDLVGHEADPIDCDRHSLRFLLYSHAFQRTDYALMLKSLPRLLSDDTVYCPNYIQCAQTRNEAEEHMHILLRDQSRG
jgi:Nucleoside diphosphate kinase